MEDESGDEETEQQRAGVTHEDLVLAVAHIIYKEHEQTAHEGVSEQSPCRLIDELEIDGEEERVDDA